MMRLVTICATTVLAGTALGAGTATAAPTVECAPQGVGQISVYSGEIDCEQAHEIALSYDYADLDTYQEIGDFTCYLTPADMKPIFLECDSATTRFVVSEP